MACDNCKDPIYLNTASIISTPICQDDCPTEINCNGEVTYTDCVKTTIAFDCIGTSETATQTEINQAINDKLCENQQSTCTVSVDANDTCCGYLGDKLIAGTGVTITKNIATDTEGCKTLTVSESCYTWNNVLASSATGTGRFRNKWTNLDNSGIFTGIAQYSNVKSCAVKLRGVVTIAGYNNTKEIIAVLPFATTTVRRFSVNVLVGSAFIPTVLDVYPDGSLKLFTVTGMTGTISLSLDGISFDTV